MIKAPQLATFFLALALPAMVLMAPWEAAAQGEQSGENATPEAAESAPSAATPNPKPAPEKIPSNTGNESPFDYRPSEEISEDVPVSFPVDI